MEALFGKEKYLIDLSRSKSSEPEMTRELDGVWTSKPGPRYTRLSAALVVVGLSPWNLPRANIRLYHNPWANLPYNSELTLLPQAILLTGQAKLEDGKSLSSVFDLPYEWPEIGSPLGESEDVECWLHKLARCLILRVSRPLAPPLAIVFMLACGPWNRIHLFLYPSFTGLCLCCKRSCLQRRRCRH